jgi:hypothetical protein
MSGRDLAEYQGGDESGHSVTIPDDSGPLTESIQDRVDDIRSIVADQKREKELGLKRGEITKAKGGPKRLTTHDRRAGPPAGASEVLSRHWAALPKEVRADVRKLQDQHAAYAGAWAKINPYADLCRRNGTTLATALGEYSRLENTLMANPVAALQEISARLGWDSTAVMSEWLRRDVAGQQPAQQASQHPAISREDEFAARQLVQQVADFEKDTRRNPHFEILKGDMIRLLELGHADSLRTAYDLALQYSPQAARQRNAVSQARAAGKAVSGAPSSGTNQHVLAGLPANAGVRETIRAAINAQLGRS